MHTLTLMEAARPAPPTDTQQRFGKDVARAAVQRYRGRPGRGGRHLLPWRLRPRLPSQARTVTLPSYRQDDPLLDTDTARIMKAMLAGMSRPDIDGEADLPAFLHRVSGLDTIVDPSTREATSALIF